VEGVINKMAESSLRTLCLAYKPISDTENVESKDQKGIYEVEKNNLTMLCILGVRDIPRQEVYGAIEKCHRAGIKVRMVTGDNITTATAIARDVGIIKEGDGSTVMEGADFMKLVGGVVCKACRTKECGCALDLNQAETMKIPLRVDTI
jgi:P-type Ca2+ transporter type 2B